MSLPRSIRRVGITTAATLAMVATGTATATTASAGPLSSLSNPLHRTATATAASDDDGAATATAHCPPAYHATSGGYALSNYSATVYTNRPTPDGTGWEVYASNHGASQPRPFRLKAYVQCSLL